VVTVNDHVAVGATFAQVFKVGVSKSKTGTVSAGQPGIDGPLSCGTDCTTTYAAGTVVTLTATPAAGKQFLNWSGGACSGSTALICTFVVARDTSVQPVFSK
jgi:List-Bact-rpt repeat protein